MSLNAMAFTCKHSTPAKQAVKAFLGAVYASRKNSYFDYSTGTQRNYNVLCVTSEWFVSLRSNYSSSRFFLHFILFVRFLISLFFLNVERTTLSIRTIFHGSNGFGIKSTNDHHRVHISSNYFTLKMLLPASLFLAANRHNKYVIMFGVGNGVTSSFIRNDILCAVIGSMQWSPSK